MPEVHIESIDRVTTLRGADDFLIRYSGNDADGNPLASGANMARVISESDMRTALNLLERIPGGNTFPTSPGEDDSFQLLQDQTLTQDSYGVVVAGQNFRAVYFGGNNGQSIAWYDDVAGAGLLRDRIAVFDTTGTVQNVRIDGTVTATTQADPGTLPHYWRTAAIGSGTRPEIGSKVAVNWQYTSAGNPWHFADKTYVPGYYRYSGDHNPNEWVDLQPQGGVSGKNLNIPNTQRVAGRILAFGPDPQGAFRSVPATGGFQELLDGSVTGITVTDNAAVNGNQQATTTAFTLSTSSHGWITAELRVHMSNRGHTSAANAAKIGFVEGADDSASTIGPALYTGQVTISQAALAADFAANSEFGVSIINGEVYAQNASNTSSLAGEFVINISHDADDTLHFNPRYIPDEGFDNGTGLTFGLQFSLAIFVHDAGVQIEAIGLSDALPVNTATASAGNSQEASRSNHDHGLNVNITWPAVMDYNPGTALAIAHNSFTEIPMDAVLGDSTTNNRLLQIIVHLSGAVGADDWPASTPIIVTVGQLKNLPTTAIGSDGQGTNGFTGAFIRTDNTNSRMLIVGRVSANRIGITHLAGSAGYIQRVTILEQIITLS